MRSRSTLVKRDGTHDTNVLFELWRLSRAASALLEVELNAAGISGDEFGIYSVLAHGEALTPSELARWMSAPATTVSSHIKRLEARGHVTRTRSAQDRRSYTLRLTPSGRAVYRHARAIYQPILQRVVGHLGRTEPDIRRSLIALREAIDASVESDD